jgi:hypothetical protein
MKTINTYMQNAKQRPVIFGLFVIVAVIVLGASLAFATGVASPKHSFADDFSDVTDGLPSDTSAIQTSINDNSSDVTDGLPSSSTGFDQTPINDNTSDVTNGLPTDVSTPSDPGTTPVSYIDQPCNCDNVPTTDVGTTPITYIDQPCNCDNVPTNNSGTTPETYIDQPCNCDNVTPVEIQPIVDVPPVISIPPVVVVLPPVITPPIIIPPHICAPGYTGTYPNCIPPVIPPHICAPGETGIYPNCIPPTTPVCTAGYTGTYPNCVPPVTGCISNCSTGGGSSGGTIFSGGFSGSSISYSGSSGQIIHTAPVASYVYLSQIPYTGLDLGPIGTVVYWAVLILWCLAAAYLIIFNLIPFLYRRLTGFGTQVGHVLNTPAGFAVAGAAHGSSHGDTMTHDSHAPVAQANPSAYTAVQGFRTYAQGAEALTIDDIVKGLSRLPDNTTVTQKTESHVVETVPEAPSIHQIMQQPVTVAPRAEAAPAAVSTDVRDFIAALLNGDRDTVFATIRQITREGGDAEIFLTQVVCALDDAYRARLENTKVHPEIAQLTQNCATSFLERLTAALTNAVDSSYSPGVTGAKLALTRALGVVEG